MAESLTKLTYEEWLKGASSIPEGFAEHPVVQEMFKKGSTVNLALFRFNQDRKAKERIPLNAQ